MADRFAPWPVQTMIVSRNEALTPLFLTLNFRRPGRDELTFPSGSTAGARLAVREPCSASGPVAPPGLRLDEHVRRRGRRCGPPPRPRAARLRRGRPVRLPRHPGRRSWSAGRRLRGGVGPPGPRPEEALGRPGSPPRGRRRCQLCGAYLRGVRRRGQIFVRVVGQRGLALCSSRFCALFVCCHAGKFIL